MIKGTSIAAYKDLRESISRHVDKKPGGPQGERGLDSQGEGKDKLFFSSTFLKII